MSNLSSNQRMDPDLARLSKEKNIRYVLTARRTGQETSYGVRVVEEGACHTVREESYFFASRQEQAECLLTHLYENAAPERRCVSVIADVCGVSRWEAHDGPCPDSTAPCG